jgi:hypothetical protein
MSKNWIRRTVRLKPGEALVVADVWFWQHIMDLYRSFAESCTVKAERDDWMSVVTLIEDWIDRSTYSEEEYSDEQ